MNTQVFPEHTLDQFSPNRMGSKVLCPINSLSFHLFCIIFFRVQFIEIRELGRTYIDNSKIPIFVAEEEYFQFIILLCSITTTHIEIGHSNPTERKSWRNIYLHTLGIS